MKNESERTGCHPHDDLTEQTLRDGLFVCVACGSPTGIEQPPCIPPERSNVVKNENDRKPVCVLLLPRKRGEWAECPHGLLVRAGAECKYGPALGENPHPAATYGERDIPPDSTSAEEAHS